MSLEMLNSHKCFGGWQRQYRHPSTALNCSMQLSVFLPPQAKESTPVPALYWLSGLTCSDDNFTQKAGAQRIAAELGIALIIPDTSPRGDEVPDADDGAYDLGLGAGFYVNATQPPWDQHYRMYDYLVDELPALLEAELPISQQRAIAGHSMGGHGALVIALRNPERYCAASAFSPIANPSACPWGQKALGAYLGADPDSWRDYDASLLLAQATQPVPMLVDQGGDDPFLNEQLRPESLVAAADANDYPLALRMRDGYDHSYFFIASFIEDHLRFHRAQFNLERSADRRLSA